MSMFGMRTMYLAGPIGGLTWEECTGWRTAVDELMKPVTCWSPLRPMGNVDIRASHFIIDNGGRETSAETNGDGRVPFKLLFERDYEDVRNADLVFVNFLPAKRYSQGTLMEVSRAYALGIPLIGVMQETGNPNDGPFLRMHFEVENDADDENPTFYNSMHTDIRSAVNAARRFFKLPEYAS